MEKLLRGLVQNRTFAITSALVLLLLLVAVAAPLLAPWDPLEAVLRNANLPPSPEHLMGTDKLGRDCLSRILYGSRYSLGCALLLVSIIFVLGTALGAVAGYWGGRIDGLIMGAADMMISFPGMILAIAVAGILRGGLINAIIALTLVSWCKYARLARSMTMRLKERDFVAAAVVTGTKPLSILMRHILPNELPLLAITAGADIGVVIMELAGLSFLGLGAPPPAPEWGLMLNEGRQQLQTAPWLMVYPGLAIFISVAIFNLWSDALRDLLDPRQQS